MPEKNCVEFLYFRPHFWVMWAIKSGSYSRDDIMQQWGVDTFISYLKYLHSRLFFQTWWIDTSWSSLSITTEDTTDRQRKQFYVTNNPSGGALPWLTTRWRHLPFHTHQLSYFRLGKGKKSWYFPLWMTGFVNSWVDDNDRFYVIFPPESV